MATGLRSRWMVTGSCKHLWGSLPWGVPQSLSLLHLSTLVFFPLTFPHRRNQFILPLKGSMEGKGGTKMIIYTYYCLTYRLSFTFYTASWLVLFQKASLSIILRRELLGTTLPSITWAELSSRLIYSWSQYSFSIEAWGLQTNRGHCWLHWKEASSVLVSYSNVYPKNSWAEELLWKTSFRTLSRLLYRLIIPGAEYLIFRLNMPITSKLASSSILFISLFSTTTQNAESHSHLYSIKDTVVNAVDTEVTHEYMDHTH